ncbi:hypothetical protein GOODEAATRI_026304, partial [Goodea atripinnis]
MIFQPLLCNVCQQIWLSFFSDYLCVLCSAPPPKIVFNRVNGKRHNGTATQKSQSLAAEGFTPAHEENVRFVYEGEDYRTSGPR